MTTPPDNTNGQADHTTVTKQIEHSGVGEIVGFGISIGAVYVADHIFPAQTKSLLKKLAEKLAESRGTSPEAQKILARQIADVTIMNVGGLMNMVTQVGLHRHALKPEDRQPLGSELSRVLTGRVVGTAGAIGALALAETHAPHMMNRGENWISKKLGGTNKTDRFAELALSNAVQSVGGIAGNVPAQLLYDKLIGPVKTPTR